MEPVLQIENLRFGYAHDPLFADVGFTVEQGDFIGIIGANGTGKSTLLKLILGMIPPASGSIRILGQDISQFRGWQRIGYLAQGQVWTGKGFPATAAEVIQADLNARLGLFRFPGRKQREKVANILEMVGLSDKAGQLIGDLSGGQQQRVMLARVLVTDPDLMVLDEPSAGIDARSAYDLYAILQTLNHSKGMTILMVTHDIERVSACLTRVLCLENGSLIELEHDQLADELGHKHKHPVNPSCSGEC